MEYGDFFLRNLVKNHKLVKQKAIQQAKQEIWHDLTILMNWDGAKSLSLSTYEENSI